MSPLETPEAMALRMIGDTSAASDLRDVAADAIREDRRVIAEAMEREAAELEAKSDEFAISVRLAIEAGKPPMGLDMCHHTSSKADALRLFARALRGEP